MFHRFFRCILLSSLLIAVTPRVWAQCPDTQPVITGADIACDQNAALTYTYSTPATIGTPTHSYQWVITPAAGRTIVGATNQNQLQVKWQSTGTYTVQVTEWNNDPAFPGCIGVVATKTVNVQPLLHAYFYYQFDPSGGCYYNVVNFTGDVSVHADPNVTYTWDFGDGTPVALGPAVLQHTFPITSGLTYTVSLTITNSAGQTDQITDYVYVNPDQYKPVAVFSNSAVPMPNNCLYNPMSFDASNSLPKPSYNPENITIIYYEWNFGDPGSGSSNQVNSGTNPIVSHVFSDFGMHTITLIVTNSKYCTHTYTKDIFIDNTVPIASFTNSLACIGEATQFTTTSTTPVGSITQLEWIFGDGFSYTSTNPAEIITHTYQSLATYNAKLRVTNSNNCISEYFIKSVSVNPAPSAGFLVGNACLGEAVAFTNTSGLNGGSQISGYLWNFDDPLSGSNSSTDPNPTHMFSAVGSYNVSLQVTNTDGCANTYTISPPLIVNPKPSVDFTFQNGTQNWEILFHNITGPSVGNNLVWDFGDGTFGYGPDPSHVYSGPGNFLVTLTATDASSGCSNSIQQLVTLQGTSSAFFSSDSPKCVDELMHFTPQIPGGDIVKEVWDFGDGNVQTFLTGPFPIFATHAYASAGTFPVTRTVTYGTNFFESFSIQVVVFPIPTANFTYSNNAAFPNTYACANQAVYFTDLSFSPSGNIIQWFWDFGDPTSGINQTSILQNPQHIFMGGNGQTYTVTLTVTDNVNNCSDVITAPVFVNPPVPVDFTFTVNTCINQDVAFQADLLIMNPANIATWDWDFGDGTLHSTNPVNTAHHYATPATYNVILTVTDINGCSNSVTKAVTVMPLPVAAFFYASPTCDGSAVQFTDQSFIPATFPGYINQWEWNWGDGTTTVIVHPDPPNSSHLYPTGIYTFNAILSVTSNFGCVASVTHTVNLIPSPIANFEVVTNTPACATQPVQFNDLSQTNGGGTITGWLWNFGDPGSGFNNTATSPNPSHIFAIPGTYSVSLTSTNTNGCSHTVIKLIDVNPLPVAMFSTSTPTCEAMSVQFTDESTTATGTTIVSYSWAFGDGGTSTLPNPIHTYSTYGVYQVTLTVINSNGCVRSTTNPVLVNPNPIAEFTFTAASCIGSPVSFNDQSFIPSGFSGIINTWLWDFGDGNTSAQQNPQHTYSGTATSHVVRLTVTTSSGCTAYKEHTVNSIPSPVASFDVSNTKCIGQPVQFTDLSQTNGGGSIQSWSWIFDDPTSGNNTSVLPNPTHIFNGTGPFAVSLTVTSANGCSNTYVANPPININPLPVANFSTSTNTTNCEGSSIQFTDESTPINSINYWSWNFGDGGTSVQPSPQHTYSTYGIFPVTLTVTDLNGCINSINKPTTVNPKPVAQFAFSPSTGCVGSPVSFTNQSNVPPGFSSTIQSWTWDFGDGSTPTTIYYPANPNITYTFIGTATSHIVRLTVSTGTGATGCTSFIEKTVTSVPAPIAEFSWSGATCELQPTQFNDLSQQNGGGNITWNWDFGDGQSGPNNYSTLQNPTHSFSHAATFQVTLIVTNGNGCSNTRQTGVLVTVQPKADFITNVVCQGSPTIFTETTTLGNVVSRLWEFGDGQTSTINNPTHFYGTPGTFLAKLSVVTDLGCVHDTTKPVLVLGKPVPNFSYSSPNCAKDSIQFSDLSSTPHGSIQQWEWDFGDGTPPVVILFPVNPNVKHAFANGGSYNVKLTISTSDGCTAEKISLVQIGLPPVANFSAAANACQLMPIQFTDLSQLNGGPAITLWSWNFDDLPSGVNNVSTTQHPMHTFIENKPIFNVHLQVTNANGCISTITHAVSVSAAPSANFSATIACIDSPTQFTDISNTATGTTIVAWNWNFGDPPSGTNNTSTLQNPTHIYTTQGTYNVTLQVTNSNQCVNSTMIQIIVNPKPLAMFEYTPACVNDSTQFTDLSIAPGSDIQSWLWDFGCGTGTCTSTIQNPKYRFSIPGTYNVKLKVTNLSGCSDSVTIPVVSRPVPVAQFEYMNFFCPKGKVNFQDMSQAIAAAIVEREWIFEPGSTSSLPNPSYTFPVTDTTYIVTLIVMDTYGCKDTIEKDVYVKPGFKFSFANDNVCEGYTTHFTPLNQTPGDSLYSVSWNFGDPNSGANNTSLLYNPTHTFSGPGNYIVKLKAFNSDNCVDSVFKQVQVYAAPEPLFTYVSPACTDTIYFSDSTVNSGTGGIYSWKWNWGDGQPPTTYTVTTNPVIHTFAEGIYHVTLTITNINGCVDSITKTVQKFPCIMASFTVQEPLCARYEINFSDLSFPTDIIKQWRWSWGDGQETTYTNPTAFISHTYPVAGTYTVTLEIQALPNGFTITANMVSEVTIHPTPVTFFSSEPVCLHQVSFFRDTSETFGEKNTSWLWELNSGNPPATATNVTTTYKYDSAGVYNVKLVVMNKYGCKDSLTKPTRVYNLPVARYDNTAACAGDPTFFTDQSVASDTTLWKWRWFFGDPTTLKDTSQLQNPSYKYPNTGDFSMRMIVKDHLGCIDTVDSTVKVNITPLSAFTVEKGYNGKQSQIKLNNLSTGSESYFWDFGNGKSSTDKDPVASYTDDGVYIIKLITLNEFECSDTTFYEYTLLLKGLFVPNAFSPTSSNLDIRLFKPVGVNLKLGQYHVMVFDMWGHLLWESTKIDDKGKPVEGWDGTFEGNLMPQGNYMWKINAMFTDGTQWNGSDIGQGDYKTIGTITLIR